MALAASASVSASAMPAAAKTVFDEEQARADEAAAAASAVRSDALRRGFAAVAASAQQLRDLRGDIADEAGEGTPWYDAVPGVVVRFNNDVVREGMTKIGKGLESKEGRQAAKGVCEETTKGLQAASRACRGMDREAALQAVDQALAALDSFQRLAP